MKFKILFAICLIIFLTLSTACISKEEPNELLPVFHYWDHKVWKDKIGGNIFAWELSFANEEYVYVAHLRRYEFLLYIPSQHIPKDGFKKDQEVYFFLVGDFLPEVEQRHIITNSGIAKIAVFIPTNIAEAEIEAGRWELMNLASFKK